MITGGSGGIGRACVQALSVDCDVAIHYNTNRQAAKSLSDEINSNSEKKNAIIYQCDITEPDDVQKMVEKVEQDLGNIDVLVNNAAILLENDLSEVTNDEITAILRTNLVGTIYCTRAVLAKMCNQEEGRIVGVASSSGIRGSPSDPIYGASKGGMIAFVKSISRSYAQHNIFANIVAPSEIDTKMYADERRPKAKSEFPLGRLIQPEEVAKAVKFLSETSSISGEVLEVDAGRYI
jgi:3-oxoacyl-[acyl-carrier protein] reductase